jgi:uncharacterized membrane protein (DUF485 family)
MKKTTGLRLLCTKAVFARLYLILIFLISFNRLFLNKKLDAVSKT